MNTEIWVGALVTLNASFTDKAGDPVDPTDVEVSWRDPGGTVTSKTYGTDPEVERDGIGAYHVDVPVTINGNWFYRWASFGTGQAAAEGRFTVLGSKVI